MLTSMETVKKILIADAITSGLSGLALVVAPGVIAELIGVQSALIVAGVGVGLIIFAASLVINGRRAVPDRTEVAVAAGLNLAWVLASIVVLMGGWLSPLGNTAVGLVAVVVLAFAILEMVGLRRTLNSARGAQQLQA